VEALPKGRPVPSGLGIDGWLSCAGSDELAPEVDYQNSCIDSGQLMDTAESQLWHGAFGIESRKHLRRATPVQRIIAAISSERLTIVAIGAAAR
jgi:hypothetical protein